MNLAGSSQIISLAMMQHSIRTADGMLAELRQASGGSEFKLTSVKVCLSQWVYILNEWATQHNKSCWTSCNNPVLKAAVSSRSDCIWSCTLGQDSNHHCPYPTFFVLISLPSLVVSQFVGGCTDAIEPWPPLPPVDWLTLLLSSSVRWNYHEAHELLSVLLFFWHDKPLLFKPLVQIGQNIYVGERGRKNQGRQENTDLK